VIQLKTCTKQNHIKHLKENVLFKGTLALAAAGVQATTRGPLNAHRIPDFQPLTAPLILASLPLTSYWAAAVPQTS